jgi:hypothetical protein
MAEQRQIYRVYPHTYLLSLKHLLLPTYLHMYSLYLNVPLLLSKDQLRLPPDHFRIDLNKNLHLQDQARFSNNLPNVQ